MEVCRTCMNERGSEVVGKDFRSIFSNIEVEATNVYIADCLTQWVGRKVGPNDGMPSEICPPCLEAIKSITLFIQNAKDCDKKLRRILQPGANESPNDIESCIGLEMKIEVEDDSFGKLTDDEQTTDSNQQIVLSKRTKVQQESEELDAFGGIDVEQHSNFSSSEAEEGKVTHSKKGRGKGGRFSVKAEKEPKDNYNSDESDTFNVIESQNQIPCCGCLKFFDTEKELEHHGGVVHEETKRRNNPVNVAKTNVCKVCYKRFATHSPLIAHRNRYQRIDRVYECKKCSKRFLAAESVRKHALLHANDTIEHPKLYPISIARLEKYGYLCCVKKCSSSHTSENALLEHISKDHNLITDAAAASSELQCPFCQRSYASQVKLQAHYNNLYTTYSLNASRHQCHQCGEIFKTQTSLNSHVNKHAQTKPYECDFCSKSFYSDSALKQHKLIHTQDKTSTCSICGRAFRTKHFLENHYRVHSDEKPFACDICHKTFRYSSSLFMHKGTHATVKRHQCSVCGKGFTDTANMSRHMVMHTGIKPYQCQHCEKRFMRLAEKSEHESIVHMGIMPYACEICGKAFSSKRPFLKHEASCTGGRLQ
ncbi:zinc finger protein 883-like [Aedes albopictus]|uniref:C2h2-type zn-finger protein n=1 Tax=Aedes albopictus TaxID=7160 RepID=A0ABM1Z1E9_AEDAL